MEYVQEAITTLHDLTDPVPDAPTDRAAVVVPMTDREYGGLAAERVLSALEDVGVARVLVALRAPAERVGPFREWLDEFDLPLELLWCNGPALADLLADRGLDGTHGKGRDVWLALGVAADDHEFVAVHDADARTYSSSHVPRLLAPLGREASFVKGYYARVEHDRLYGRLFRLFYAPLVRALANRHDDPLLDYLGAFRYALAGEFATTAALARSLRVQPEWGLEVGTLGEAYATAGFEGTAQVDLGRHEHDHRSVGGPTGLSDMSEQVGAALFRALEDASIFPDYGTLAGRYRDAAHRLVDQYAADAAFNGLDHDAADERAQVATYADAVAPPGEDDRLPAWDGAPLSAADVRRAAGTDLANTEG